MRVIAIAAVVSAWTVAAQAHEGLRVGLLGVELSYSQIRQDNFDYELDGDELDLDQEVTNSSLGFGVTPGLLIGFGLDANHEIGLILGFERESEHGETSIELTGNDSDSSEDEVTNELEAIAFYEFNIPMAGGITPFVGIGVGMVRAWSSGEEEDEEGNDLESSTSLMMFFAGPTAGVKVDIAENVTLDLTAAFEYGFGGSASDQRELGSGADLEGTWDVSGWNAGVTAGISFWAGSH
jgi:opacity protein-like surface antigen